LQPQLTFVRIGSGAFGGTAGDTLLEAIGFTYIPKWAVGSFVSVQPHLGLLVFTGEPDDLSGSDRRHVAVESPLAIYYRTQLYRDDSTQPKKLRLAGFVGGLAPTTFDTFDSGFNWNIDLGVQAGLSVEYRGERWWFEEVNAISKFLAGVTYQDDVAGSYWDEVDGQANGYHVALHALYLPNRMGVTLEYLFTSSTADIQGDSMHFWTLKWSWLQPGGEG